MTPWNGIVSCLSNEGSCIFFALFASGVPSHCSSSLGAAKRREAAFEFMKLPITLMSAGFRFEKWRILSVQSVLQHAALWHFKSLLTFKGGINSTFIARAMAIIHQLLLGRLSDSKFLWAKKYWSGQLKTCLRWFFNNFSLIWYWQRFNDDGTLQKSSMSNFRTILAGLWSMC